MNSANIKEIFLEAIEISLPEQRNAYLDQTCGPDSEIRRRIDSLISAHEGPESLLDQAAVRREVPATNEPSSSTDNRVGGVLGDFRLIREIGRGGMGVVYEAEQVSLRRRVALKVLPFAAVLDPRQLRRFETEALAAAGLHHGNIVPVHHFGSERAVHFYAMQYIEGQDVAALIGQLRQFADLDGGELPETRAADFELASSIVSGQFAPLEPTRRLAPLAVAEGSGDHFADVAPKTAGDTRPMAELSTKGSTSKPEYFRTIAGLGIQAAEALQFAHGRGILHRDIKPSNLMLDGDGKLWITDFGLARVEGDAGLTMTGDVMGTLRYMSPEQALGQRDVVDGRSDVYSLGVTLYEMLTLTPIYPTTDRNELLQKRAQEEPAPLRQVNKEVPVDLETIVLKAIAKEPNDRYSTAQEFADDLRRFLNHEPIRAKRPSAVNRLGKWVQRHKSLAALFAVLMLGGPLAGYGVMALLTKKAPAGLGQARPKIAKQSPPAVKPSVAPAKGSFLPGLVPEPTSIAEIGRWQVTTKKPRGVLKSGVWSPDETLIAVGEAGNVRIYDATNLRLLHVLVGHSQHVTSIDWHPQGQQLASASWDGTVRLWTVDGVPTHELTGDSGHAGEVYQVQWSPNGEQLASCGADGAVRLWEANGDFVKLLGEHGNHVFCLDWSPDGKLLASAGGQMGPPDASGDAGDNAIRVWDVANSELRAKFEGHEYSVLALDWHPDGEQLAAGDGDLFRAGQGLDDLIKKAGVRIWQLDSTVGPKLGKDISSVNSVAWNRNGTQLAFGGRKNVVHVWDVSEEKVTNSIAHDTSPGNKMDLYCVRWSLDGSRLLATSRSSMREWSLDGERLKTLDRLSTRGYSYVAWSPDGTKITTRGKVWQADGTPVEKQESDDEWMKFVHRNSDQHPSDGRIARPGGGGIQVLTAEKTIDWAFRMEGDPTPYVRTASWSPDGELLAVGSWRDQALRIWKGNGELIKTIKAHRGGVESVAWSLDGKFLASAGGKTVRLWTPDGEPIRTIEGHTEELYDVAWSPDGKWIASAGTDATIRLWKLDGTKGPVLRGHHGGVFDIAWSPDSKRIVSNSWLDSTLRMWDVAKEETQWQLLQIGDDETITLSSTGTVLHGDHSRFKRALLYLLEKRDSSMEVLEYGDFHEQFAETLLTHLSKRVRDLAEDKKFDEADILYPELLAFGQLADPQVTSKLIATLRSEFGYGSQNRDKHERAINAFTDAVILGRKLVEKFPENNAYRQSLSKSLSGRSYSSYMLDQYDKAVADATEALQFDPANSNAHNRRGLGHVGLKQFNKALADISQAIELSPENSIYYRNRGFVHKSLNQFQKAMEDLTKSLELNPQDGISYARRGMLNYELNQYQAARDDFNKAHEISPQDAQLIFFEGRAFDGMHNYQEAVSKYGQALEIQRDNPVYLFRRGVAFAVLKQYGKAISDLGRAKQFASQEFLIHYMHAFVQLAANDVSAFRSNAARMLQKFGETPDAEAAYWTAWTCGLIPGAVNDRTTGLRLAKQALATDPDSPKYLQTAGLLLFRTGNYDEARDQLMKVAAHWDENGVTTEDTSPAYGYFFLAMTHHRLGDPNKAKSWFEKAVHWVEHEEKKPMTWNREFTLKLFQEEAEAMLNSTTPSGGN